MQWTKSCSLPHRSKSAQPALVDVYSVERRFEQRFPGVAAHLPEFVQGYDRSPESALAILEFLEAHFDVNTAIAARIRTLCAFEVKLKGEQAIRPISKELSWPSPTERA